MNNIHLYIGDTEVEFDASPEILYTYQVDDLTNPTIVKNSFSKTITIKGTKSNNHLFGHYWNVERSQVGGSNNASGVYFNASKKMAFSLYVDSEIYEQGYVKLDEVRRVNGDYEYDISLFGGLGDFFYCLTTSEEGDKKKLSDLDFDHDLDFTINIDTIKEAWSSLKYSDDDKWKTINFMPAYNGLPDDFDADKMIMDIKNTNLTKAKTEDGKTYKTKDNWVMAELPDEMTEWETRDLRSYLQRPCIRMKKIIEACCKPKNNGGYEVVLDNDFFNSDNPYWEDTWLSLPMIQALEYDSGEQALENSTLIVGSTEGNPDGLMYQSMSFDMGEFPSSVVSRINLKATINPGVTYSSRGHFSTSWKWFWNRNGDSYHTGNACYGSLFCQLLAFNGDTVVGASSVKNLTTPIRHNGKLWYGNNSRYDGGHKFTPYMAKPIYDYLGEFRENGFVLENETQPVVLDFTIDGLTTNVTAIKMCYYWGASKDKMKKNGAPWLYDETKESSWVTSSRSARGMTDLTQYKATIKSTTLKAVMGGTIGRTGTEVTKNLILNTEASPCDYLLSYCKMFGLYFSKSIYENVIYVQTRKTFYERGVVNDITGDVDYSKGINIKPITFDTKWVEFSQEQDETQYVTDYNTTKGVVYGSKVLNTGYEFNSEKKSLLEGNVIKSGIEGLERSKYFTCYNNDDKVRPWFGYGLRYYLYNENDTIEMIGSNAIGSNILGINEGEGLKYYDLFPKLQFHDKDNKPTDGNNCLVFFSGFKDLTSGRANPINYFLTDDSYYQTQLNEGSPCWLFVSGDKDINGKAVSRKIEELPVFERYLTGNGGTNVAKSLDFGSPQELFISKYGMTDEVNIYHYFWKSYLEDLYDINTKILTLYVRFKSKVGYDLLREFYWFENAIWRINRIVDWGIGTEEPTKVEFVKVQDIANYTTITQAKPSSIKIEVPKHFIDFGGEVIKIKVYPSNGGDWYLVSNNNIVEFSSKNGNGEGEVLLTIPQTQNLTSQTIHSITAIDKNGNTTTINLVQGYPDETRLKLNPNSLIVDGEGGEYNVDFLWVNQGQNIISQYALTGDVRGIVDVDGFTATINIERNPEDSVISGVVSFEGNGFEGEVYINQLPSVLEFDKDGGEYELSINNDDNVTYSDLPYWVTMEGNKMVVLPNHYETERSGKIRVKNGYSEGFILVKQSKGIDPSKNAQKVTPQIIHFDKDGGDRFVTINIPNSWEITESLEWVNANITSGYSNDIIKFTAQQNKGFYRDGTITILDNETNETHIISVSQAEFIEDLSVEPTSIVFDSEGGTATITIKSNSDWTIEI